MTLSVSLWQFLAVFATAFLLTLLLVPQNILFSRKYKILAHPNSRSIHSEPIPTAGGLSFGLVIVLLQAIIGWLNIGNEYGSGLIRLAGISLLVLALGLFDDRFRSRVRYKLLGQIVIAMLMFYAGYRVSYLTNPFGGHFLLGWLSLPVTLLWFLMTMNAINLIDGLDGLAAGITCIVSIVLAIVGMIFGNPLVLALTAILLGTNLAFLKYNFYPARIFMGDTGSLIIGLTIAAISTAGNTTYKGITAMTMMVPVIALAIPFIDTVLAIFRRIGKGSIFQADKAHLHHYLLRLGLSQKTIALITYFITGLFGLAAIGFSFSSKKILFSIVVLLMASLIMLAYYIIHRGQKQ
jgi:UDP-GlcNAc:undecaprenyl-phosphate/decaprenyl-phosphate GlcNAc-1-phosphate transferase